MKRIYFARTPARLLTGVCVICECHLKQIYLIRRPKWKHASADVVFRLLSVQKLALSLRKFKFESVITSEVLLIKPNKMKWHFVCMKTNNLTSVH